MPKTATYTNQHIEIEQFISNPQQTIALDDSRHEDWVPHIMERAIALLSGLLAEDIEESPIARSLERQLAKYSESKVNDNRAQNSLDADFIQRTPGKSAGSFDINDTMRELAEARKCFIC